MTNCNHKSFVSHRRHASRPGAHQSGAALVVSMVLLMVLTVLAVSTMRTASLEITMAGNDQYAENAFQLAETGLDRHIATALANPGVCDVPSDGGADDCDVANEAIAGMYGEFTTEGTYIDESSCPGANTIGYFNSYNFEVVSTGETDTNGAISQNSLGWYLCR